MQLSKIRPFRAGAPFLAQQRAGEGQPRITAEQKNTCPRAQDLNLQPHGPSLPKTRDNTQRRRRPDRKEQPLRCGKPDLAHRSASFKTSLRTSPKRDRLAADTEGGASQHQLQGPVTQASRRRTALRRPPRTGRPSQTLRPGSPGLGGEEHPFRQRLKWCLSAPSSSTVAESPRRRTAFRRPLRMVPPDRTSRPGGPGLGGGNHLPGRA